MIENRRHLLKYCLKINSFEICFIPSDKYVKYSYIHQENIFVFSLVLQFSYSKIRYGYSIFPNRLQDCSVRDHLISLDRKPLFCHILDLVSTYFKALYCVFKYYPTVQLFRLNFQMNSYDCNIF